MHGVIFPSRNVKAKNGHENNIFKFEADPNPMQVCTNENIRLFGQLH